MKRSRFFCEHCHQEVRPSAKVCPHCGRFFEAVRCPVCSYVGEAQDFLQGCPNCGYAGGDPAHDEGFERIDYPVGSGRRKPTGAPSWVWPLAIGTLLVLFAALVVVYLNL